jgi:uncharacterized membrane protein YkvA (DUF1232 family)
MNNNFLKGMILAFIIVYIVSPVDACPGPVDDLLVMILGIAARKSIGTTES